MAKVYRNTLAIEFFLSRPAKSHLMKIQKTKPSEYLCKPAVLYSFKLETSNLTIGACMGRFYLLLLLKQLLEKN